MRLTINGKGMEISDYLKDVVEKRVGKLDKYLREDAPVQVMLSMFRGRQVAEITVSVGGAILRAEEATGDLYASVDNATKKLERQILRYRTRMDKRIHSDSIRFERPDEALLPQEEPAPAEEHWPKVVRTKHFAVKPMSIEEAAMQMELLDHAFFVFQNAQSGEVNVLYKRNDGDLGLIEPELD